MARSRSRSVKWRLLRAAARAGLVVALKREADSSSAPRSGLAQGSVAIMLPDRVITVYPLRSVREWRSAGPMATTAGCSAHAPRPGA